MGSFNDYSDAPTVFFPPHHHQYGSLPHRQSYQAVQSPGSNGFQPRPTRPPLVSNPSRKRSRDDVDDDEPVSLYDVTPTAETPPEPLIYGEGMTLVDPVTGRSTTAESQTGTWYEDYLEEERQASIKAIESLARDAADALAQNRPAKCQRLDLPLEVPVQSKVELLTRSQTPSQLYAGPAIDAASVMLGVGWTVIGQEEHIQCAARGWTKYIENHYPSLTNVEILLKSEGREAFLVKAMCPVEGLFLFSEDLNEARLVAHDWETCIAILRASPSLVDHASETLRAVRTPALCPTIAMDYLQDQRPLTINSTNDDSMHTTAYTAEPTDTMSMDID